MIRAYASAGDCRVCDGLGFILSKKPADTSVKCPSCNGTGQKTPKDTPIKKK